MNAPASNDLFTRFKVIDVDTHITEPPGVWIDRVPKKWGSAVPHIERVDGVDIWMADGVRIAMPGSTSMAGWKGVIPDSPKTYDDIAPSMYDAKERLAHMDRLGIYAQVLYPNVGGFGAGYFQKMADRELSAACLQAYNDFLIEWSSADANRLLPVMSTPFWDVDFAVDEIARCAAMGHRAVNFCNAPDVHGQPPLGSKHWDPIWRAAQENNLPISFHIGGGDIGSLMTDSAQMGFQANFARASSLILVDNMRCVADLIFGGVCHRFPEVKFVSVESGIGWVPGVLEVMDWQWSNGGIKFEHPEYDLLPSEYFKRQIYACFWFERASAINTIRQMPDNILYETDYPHPTCQHPGPVTPARFPREYATDALSELPDDILQKVFFDNAAKLYGVKP